MSKLKLYHHHHFIWSVVLVVLLKGHVLEGQQIYVKNKQLDCYKDLNYTDGFACNGVATSCSSYLTFRSNPPYNTPSSIGLLLGSSPSAIAEANNLTNFQTIPTDTQILIPVDCSCSTQYYQYNATYKLQSKSDTYFIVANDTYQGLSTCQALMAQNPSYGDKNLTVGLNLTVPLRCACPTSNQRAAGFKYLVTYMITWGDDISSIAALFGADEQSVLDANQLSEDSIIYPFTPILVPLKTRPSKIQKSLSPPPPASPPQTTVVVSPGKSKSNNKWVVYVAVGVSIGAAALILLFVLLFCFFCRRSPPPPRKDDQLFSTSPTPPHLITNTKLSSDSWSVSTQGVRYAIESLTVYKFDEVEKATGFFGEANRIIGSVYRGTFKGDDGAVKVMKGDVSDEINLLKRINHTNIIRLSGYCLHAGNTYLVYEYANNGSLTDCLHSNNKYKPSLLLTWKQRVQIAHDIADALNYLHNYTNPPYIHKNLKTSNILVDANFRAKISNFRLARTVEMENQEEEGGGLQLTRHVVGTQGYMAPEYIENGVLTPKLDVFAFGVVLLELLSGREATGKDGGGEEELLSASVRGVLEGDNVREKLKAFVDPSLEHYYPLDLAFSMAQLAKNCVAHDLNSRPAIAEVFMTLSKILSSSLDWDPSDELERSTSLAHSIAR